MLTRRALTLTTAAAVTLGFLVRFQSFLPSITAFTPLPASPVTLFIPTTRTSASSPFLRQPFYYYYYHHSSTTTTSKTTTSKTTTAIQMTMTMSEDYATRKASFHLADRETLVEHLRQVHTVVLDVRTDAEIASDGVFRPQGCEYIHVPCSPTDASDLVQQAPTLLPLHDKKDTPIIVYCKSGRRANTAKQALIDLGYTNVLNAGGLGDVQAMKLHEA